MSNVRPLPMLLLGIIAALAFFIQSSSCLAEHAGILSGHEHVADSSCTDSHEGDDADCCHGASTTFLTQPLSTAPLSLKEVRYFTHLVRAPEGPVEEIDYPPQRLS